MTILLSCIFYLIVSILIKRTLAVSALILCYRHALRPFGIILCYFFRLVFPKKKKAKYEHMEDAFSYVPPKPAAPTASQKAIDKTGDEISKMFVELGKSFTGVDKHIKFFFIGILNVWFFTGAYYHITWAIQYWEYTLIFITLILDWLRWTKIHKPKTN